MFSAAFQQAARPETIINGFKATGIWPLNRNVFSDQVFKPSDVTNRPYDSLENPDDLGEKLIENEDDPDQLSINLLSQNLARSLSMKENEEAHCSHSNFPRNDEKKKLSDVNDLNNFYGSLLSDSSLEFEMESPFEKIGIPHESQTTFLVTPQNILPIPSTSATGPRENRRRGKTAILTSSPYCRELTSNQSATKKKKAMPRKQGKKRKASNLAEQVDEDAVCPFCEELYSRSSESWVQCTLCETWANCKCAGIENDDVNYICDSCKL